MKWHGETYMEQSTALRSSRPASKVDFNAFVQPHLQAMRSYARRLVDESDFEDVIQDVLLKLYQLGDRLEEVREVRPWLMSAVYHRAIDLHRRRARERQVEVGGLMGATEDGEPAHDWADEGPGPDELMHQEQTQDLLSAVLGRLPQHQRELVHLHDIEGHTLAEIAENHSISVNTLKSTLNRARQGLRSHLQITNHGGLMPRNLPRAGSHGRRRRGRPARSLFAVVPEETDGTPVV